MSLRPLFIFAPLFFVSVLFTDGSGAPEPESRASWDYLFEVPLPDDRRGAPRDPAVAHLWIPGGSGPVRGILLGGYVRLEERLARDSRIREACSDAGIAILYFRPHFSATFDFAQSDAAERLLEALDTAAEVSGRPELTRVPWLTMGHSTGGIFARNVAYWKPDRVLGIIHIKSGNFQDHIPDPSRSLAGVPLLSINGEFEEYGPAGGDLRGGLRSELSLHASDKSLENQSQWVLIRAQKIDRRAGNADNVMSLVVHRGGNHTDWDDNLSQLTAQFIRSCAGARLARSACGDGPVRLTPVRAVEGWLTDADIKNPSHKAAPYEAYTGDRVKAFWHADEAMARAVEAYHRGPWTVPDPTADWPEELRYAVPEAMTDAADR